MFYIRRAQWYRRHPFLYEHVFAWLRLLFLIFSILWFGFNGVKMLEGVDLFKGAADIQNNNPLLELLPTWLLACGLLLSKWVYFRYLLAPLSTIILVIFVSGFYIRDIYALPYLSTAFRYLLSSMFGFFYTAIEIDGGSIQEEEESVLENIGGPGYVLIQPGNAVIFRDLVQHSSIALPQRYFMRPFERIGTIANLDEQQGYEEEISAVTHDGIQVTIRDVNFRYKLISDKEEGKELQRSPQNPYPFSQAAIMNMAYNRAVTDQGQETWHRGVQRTLVGVMTDFISSNNLDHITAPRQPGEDPRRELRNQLFAGRVRDALRGLGAELLWIDTGHFDIREFDDLANENVDQQRFAFWATRWIGNDNRLRAIGNAQRIALQERGRSEAQAELLKNITESMRGVTLLPNSADNIRKLLLIRTAQILEGMRDIKTWKREID